MKLILEFGNKFSISCLWKNQDWKYWAPDQWMERSVNPIRVFP